MALSFSTTARFALRWLKGTNLISDIDEGFKALAEDVDTKMMGYSEGTLAARPAAGVPNRIYAVTSGAGNGLYHDTGSAWAPILAIGTGGIYGALNQSFLINTPYEADANRPVLAVGYITSEHGEGAAIYVGGVRITEAGNNGYGGFPWSGRTAVSFLIPPGKKWEYKLAAGSAGIGSIGVSLSYLTL